ncbi:Tautomerase/MIF [Mycena venus]|uniref:Tautomerase/MIF n=1 Tax=Mycena venus TaxID=2733690 RepID=A0A8H6Y7N4_9AGAR|nr:Tautomerase/MIF [Mycena venus]
MPHLLLLLNIPVSDDRAFARQFHKVSAKALGKPEAAITINITYNGTHAKGFLAFGLTVVGLDNPDSQVQEECKAIFFKFFTEELGIPEDRGFIHFHNPAYLGSAT